MRERGKHWILSLACAVTSHRWSEGLVRLYVVSVATISVLSIPLFLVRFASPSFLRWLFRSYGLAVERAGYILILASFGLALMGCILCTAWLMGEREPPRALLRFTLVAIVLVLLHLVLVPAIMVV